MEQGRCAAEDENDWTANISFDDLRDLLLHLGFQKRVRGSHHIFVKEDEVFVTEVPELAVGLKKPAG